jgi:hypothetical protein
MRARETSGIPAMLYVHSYEVTPDRLMRYLPDGLPASDRMKLFVSAKAFELGMGRMNHALGNLLERFDWAPMGEVSDQLRHAVDLPRVTMTATGTVTPCASSATA